MFPITRAYLENLQLYEKKYLLALIVTAGCSFPQLFCQINPDILKQRGWVSYSEFGAKGDGKSDDIGAIAATHEFANKHNLKVKADKTPPTI